MRDNQGACEEPLSGDLALECLNVIVNLKQLLVDRLVNEQLTPTGTEDEWIKKASELSLRLKKEIVNGPVGPSGT